MAAKDKDNVVTNGVKLLGEVVLPGASELLENNVGKGAIAAGVGLGGPALMVAMLGPVAGGILGAVIGVGTRVLSYWDSQGGEVRWPLADDRDIKRLDKKLDSMEETLAELKAALAPQAKRT